MTMTPVTAFDQLSDALTRMTVLNANIQSVKDGDAEGLLLHFDAQADRAIEAHIFLTLHDTAMDDIKAVLAANFAEAAG